MVNYCTCVTMPDNTSANGVNSTHCFSALCDDNTIHSAYFYNVNTTLPQQQWCGDYDVNNLNMTDADYIDVQVWIKEECDRDTGEYTTIDYCSTTDHANLYQCVVTYIVTFCFLFNYLSIIMT